MQFKSILKGNVKIFNIFLIVFLVCISSNLVDAGEYGVGYSHIIRNLMRGTLKTAENTAYDYQLKDIGDSIAQLQTIDIYERSNWVLRQNWIKDEDRANLIKVFNAPMEEEKQRQQREEQRRQAEEQREKQQRQEEEKRRQAQQKEAEERKQKEEQARLEKEKRQLEEEKQRQQREEQRRQAEEEWRQVQQKEAEEQKQREEQARLEKEQREKQQRQEEEKWRQAQQKEAEERKQREEQARLEEEQRQQIREERERERKAWISSLGDDDFIQRAKKISYSDYEGYPNIGDAFSLYFKNPKWSVASRSDWGPAVVTFTGVAQYIMKNANYKIQFHLSADYDSGEIKFEYQKLYINNRDMSDFFSDLLADIYLN
jgi:hypothetical protein